MPDVVTAMMRTFAALLFAVAFAAPAVSATAAQPPAPQQQEEFVPVNELPPTEQLAAAPLLIGAYVFVIVVLFLYLVSLARRLTVVQREIERLDVDLKRTGRG